MSEKIVAIIPIRGEDEEFANGAMPMLAGRSLIEYTLLAAKEARRVDRVIVSTDNPAIADVCRTYGVEVPFLRPPELCRRTATLTQVLRHCVEWLERQEHYVTDWVVKLEITHPFRAKGVIDLVIETALSKQLDSAFLVYEEANSYWSLDQNGKPQEVGQAVDVPRTIRRPFYRDLSGLAAITRASNLKSGKLYGTNVGLIPWRDLFAIVDTHEKGGPSHQDRVGFRLAELLAPEFHRTAWRSGG